MPYLLYENPVSGNCYKVRLLSTKRRELSHRPLPSGRSSHQVVLGRTGDEARNQVGGAP